MFSGSDMSCMVVVWPVGGCDTSSTSDSDADSEEESDSDSLVSSESDSDPELDVVLLTSSSSSVLEPELEVSSCSIPVSELLIRFKARCLARWISVPPARLSASESEDEVSDLD